MPEFTAALWLRAFSLGDAADEDSTEAEAAGTRRVVIGSGGGAGEPQLWLEGGALMFSVGLPLSRPLPLSHRFAWTPPPNGWTCAPTEPPLDSPVVD